MTVTTKLGAMGIETEILSRLLKSVEAKRVSNINMMPRLLVLLVWTTGLGGVTFIVINCKM